MRLMAAIGVLIGLAGAGTLAWNEFALARQLGAFTEAQARLDGGTEGGVVHVVGTASASAPVRDPMFGFAVDALRLDRTAETYQWLETREGTGDNKNLRYEKIWSPELIRSTRFEQRSFHTNPPSLPLTSAQFRAEAVVLSMNELDPALVDALPATREWRPDRDGPVRTARLVFARAGDWLYSGDPISPKIGDVRVRFAAAPPGLLSVVAEQDGRRLVPFRTFGGGTVALAAYGDVDADEMLRAASIADWREAWAMRGFGAMAVLLGTLFAMPLLSTTFGGNAAFHGRRRVGTMLMLAAGLAAAVCAISWMGARILLQLAPLAG